MMTFKDMSHGWGSGMSYGYGLMKIPAARGIRTKGHCSEPMCVCRLGSCQLNATLIGHLGADWGSSMPLNGWIPALRASVAVSMTSVFTGLNTSLTLHENNNMQQILQC